MSGFIFFVLFLLAILAWAVEYHWRNKEPSVCVVSLPINNPISPEYQGFVPFFGPIETAREEARRYLLLNGWRATPLLDEFLHPRLPLKARIVVSMSQRYKEQFKERDRKREDAFRVQDRHR